MYYEEQSLKTITIYTETYCGFCHAAKRFFDEHDLNYQEISLDQKPELKKGLQKQFNWRTVPMILVGDKFIGGYTDMLKLNQMDTFKKLLND